MVKEGTGLYSSLCAFFKEYIPAFETGTDSAAFRKEIVSTCAGVTEDLISGSLCAVLIEDEPQECKKSKSDAAVAGPVQRCSVWATKSSQQTERCSTTRNISGTGWIVE